MLTDIVSSVLFVVAMILIISVSVIYKVARFLTCLGVRRNVRFFLSLVCGVLLMAICVQVLNYYVYLV